MMAITSKAMTPWTNYAFVGATCCCRRMPMVNVTAMIVNVKHAHAFAKAPQTVKKYFFDAVGPLIVTHGQ